MQCRQGGPSASCECRGAHLDANRDGPVIGAVADAVAALAALEARAGPQQRRPLLWRHHLGDMELTTPFWFLFSSPLS